ncbi:MAG: hypothetical protein HYZ54_13475, partial [Ignavibacteriae bacterium]|nr:hypothetical protein [Ignavibacteriota bacterium]
PIMNRKALFDIGVAGPLAGFAVCLVILIIGMTNLPPKDYLYSIHPEYMMNGGEIVSHGLYFGSTPLYDFFAAIFVRPGEFLPPMNEIYHYPFLCVGWFGMFVTALNMLPIGQLDGGHIIYAMFGKHQRIISKVFWWILLVIGMGSIVEIVLVFLEQQVYNFAPTSGILDVFAWLKTHGAWYFELWNGWLFWVIVTRFIMKLNHPPTQNSQPIGRNRMIVGYVSIVMFILCFSFKGIYIIPEHGGNNSNGLMKVVKRSIPWDD